MSAAGVVSNLYCGLYWNPFVDPPNHLCLHTIIAPDSYVSMLSGMWWHGIIEQRPFVVTCVRRRGKSFLCENEFGRYEFLQFPREFTFGVYDVDGQFFQIAEPEKALLHYFYAALRIRKRRPCLVELNLEDLDPDMLRNYAKKMGLDEFF